LTGVAKASLSSIGSVTVGSPATLNLWGKAALNLNCGTPPKPNPPVPEIPKFVPDVIFNGKTWTFVPSAKNTICTVVPCHEPWIDPATGKRPGPAKSSGIVGAAAGLAVSAASGAIGKL
jgi:hypothetical protein